MGFAKQRLLAHLVPFAAWLCLAAGLLPAPASAAEPHVLIETLGSAAQPSFVNPEGLAVDQGSGDLYVIDAGRSERQTLTVSATSGKFILGFNGEETSEIAFNAPAGSGAGNVETALANLPSIGAGNVLVEGGPGNAGGSSPYVIEFRRSLGKTDVEQLTCEDGATQLSGGSGCSVTTATQGSPADEIKRFNSDGTPDDFSALSGNAIDGKGAGDGTPQNGLSFANFANEVQIAIDESGGTTDGDIYVAQGGSSKVVEVFASTGEYVGQLTEFEEGLNANGSPKALGLVCGVGIDPTGSVYVGDYGNSEIHKYDPSANPVANADNVANFGFSQACPLALGAGPSAGSLFATHWRAPVEKLNSSTGALEYQVSPGENTTVTVDPVTGYLYAAKGSSVLVYDASGPSSATLIETIPIAGKVTGIAVHGNANHLYVARQGSAQIEVYGVVVVPDTTTEAATQVLKTTATLNGTINPQSLAITECAFEYGETTGYGQTAPCDTVDGTPISGPGEIPADSSPHSVSADLSGLDPNTKYHFRLVAANSTAGNQGADLTFETFGPPVIKSQLAAEITSSEAKISGLVSPRGEASEVAVQYVGEADFLQSGYAEAITAPSQAKAIGSGVSFVEFIQVLKGLEADTAYHFRLIAQNESDPVVHGADQTFATFVEPGAELPDNRAYELVSPPVKVGEVFPPTGQSSLGGSCGPNCVPGWSKQKMPMQASPDGDAVVYEGQPFSTGLSSGHNEYLSSRSAGGWSTLGLSSQQFSSTFTQGYKAFSADLSRGVIYQAVPSLTPDAPTDYANLYLWRTGGALQPLLGAEPPNRTPGPKGGNNFDVLFAGANAGAPSTPAFSHVVFTANDALTADVPGVAPEAPAVGASEENLYEWVDGELRLVNVLPGNTTASPDAVIGSGQLLAGAFLNDHPNFDHAISDDGRRIFWSDKASGRLYVREDGETTIQVPDPGVFLTASADGAKVLLNNGHIYDLQSESTEDLTQGQGGFKGILGVGDDLSRVYFVDSAALTAPSEENENGEHAEAGENNLYAWHEGELAFVGVLLGEDRLSWAISPSNRTAQVSPDGRYLAFMSHASLTGYDNELTSGEKCNLSANSACFEVFEYDAQTATLSCPSCNPSGLPPLGESNLSLINPQSSVSIPQPPLPQPENLTAGGRLFFESLDSLSPRDANGRLQDVYEWEPNGLGDCKRPKGCLSLISSGTGTSDAYFMNATPSGNDAFFITRERLLLRDKDELTDVYDARVDGGLEAETETTRGECQGEACQPAAVVPSYPTPSSSSFNGAGNEKPKAKKHKKKRKHRAKRRDRKRAANHGRAKAKKPR